MTQGVIIPGSSVIDGPQRYGVLAEDIRAEVQRIILSEGFVRSERLKRFLGFIVEETLAGRGHQIKAYTIAVSVCDRDERFDSRLDPIVRIEAGRLRRALQHHYLTTGQSDPVLIDIPKGGYHPIFTQRAPEVSEVAAVSAPPEHANTTAVVGWKEHGKRFVRGLLTWPPHFDRAHGLRTTVMAAVVMVLSIAWWLADHVDGVRDGTSSPIATPASPAKITLMRGPSIVLLPFENLSYAPAEDFFAQGLTEDLTRYLSQRTDLVVHAAAAGARLEHYSDPRAISSEPPVSFVVKGSVRRAGERVRVNVQLLDAQSGINLWAETYDRVLTLANIFDMQDDIARSLVARLAGPAGVIAETASLQLSAHSPTPGFGTYECTLLQYRFMRSWRDADHVAARECFERAVADHPSFAAGWGALAYLYLNEYRYGYGHGAADAATLRRALVTAQRAVELEPQSVGGWEALATALYYGKEFDRAFEATERLHELAPGDVLLAAKAGWRRAFAGVGQWTEGMSAFYAAMTQTPRRPGWYYVITALDAYRRGEDGEALTAARKIDMPGFVERPLISAMIYGQLGKLPEAADALNEARSLNAAVVENPRQWFGRGMFDEALLGRMMEGLNKAGLKLPVEGGLTGG